MRLNKIMALAIACGISASAYATDTFDMGNVQVVGKDDQSNKVIQSLSDISFTMTDKEIPMPELTPEMASLDYKPLTEKPTLSNIHRENKNEFSAALGFGNKKSNEIYVNGKGQNENYNADFLVIRQTKDGYKSKVDTERTGLKARISATNVDATILNGGLEILSEKKALRGTNTSIDNGTDANAKLSNDAKRVWINGDSTLENGAFVKGYATVDVLDRETTNDVGFSDDQNIRALRIGGNYQDSINDKMKAKASLDIRRETMDTDYGEDVSFTKLVASGGVEKEFSPKTLGGFGLKAMKLKNKDRLSPYAMVSYAPDDAWKLTLSYEENLGNDSLEEMFMPDRYVDTKGFDFKASVEKTVKFSTDYKTKQGHILGIDLFSQREKDSAEYYDIDNFDGQRILSSRIAYADAKRKGITLRGDFKFDEHFTITLRGTAQDPKDSNGNRLSYEPKRILDVGLNYANRKLMIDFTRRAEYDRKAYAGVNGGPIAEKDASDYSRSDIAIRYKLDDRFTTYVKIKDLYDEGDKIRHDVSEEGRVTLAGLEMHF